MKEKKESLKLKELIGSLTKTNRILIDIGTNSIKMAEIEKQGKKIIVKHIEKIGDMEKYHKGAKTIENQNIQHCQ